jgi:hypothetical protein
MTWRVTVHPQPVVAFISDIWTRASVNMVNDETLEIKVFPSGHPTSPLVLDRSRYRPVDAAAFPGEFCDVRRPTSATRAIGARRQPNGSPDLRNHVHLSEDDAAVLSVLRAHPGRLVATSELAAARGAQDGSTIVELGETIARLQEWLEPQPETLEAVETADGTQYRLLVPHDGPGTESTH